MKQPKFLYEGFECDVASINWNIGGTIDHVSFYDEGGKFHTAFQKREGVNFGYNDTLLYLNLNTNLRKE